MRFELADQLPACLAEDRFLRRFLGIFDAIRDTVEMQVGGLEHVVDVSVAPDHMVRWLGGWLGIIDIDPSMPVDRQRRWVKEMGRLMWWRGTRAGIEGILRLATGEAVEVSDSGGVYPAGSAPHNDRHVEVWVASTGWTTKEYLVALLREELPAEVTFALRVGDELVWPPGTSPHTPDDGPRLPQHPAAVGVHRRPWPFDPRRMLAGDGEAVPAGSREAG